MQLVCVAVFFVLAGMDWSQLGCVVDGFVLLCRRGL